MDQVLRWLSKLFVSVDPKSAQEGVRLLLDFSDSVVCDDTVVKP